MSGLQFVAGYLKEEKLLGMAYAYEAATKYARAPDYPGAGTEP
jgi:Asp-tRNA(Asn)/Glu-tRNA(Gln) amidotransferase A subunit family amidase